MNTANSSDRDADAAQWFARLNGGAATADDFGEFTAWLEADSANAAAYDRVEGLWIDLDPPVGPEAPFVAAPRRVRARGAGVGRLSRRAGWIGAGGAIAAALALVVILPSGGGDLTTYSAPVGERQEVALADGSHLVLDSGSKVTVRMSDRRRFASVISGEAIFDVAKDARPFDVAVGDQTVRDIGTVFDVSRRGDQQSVTVLEGLVDVSQKGAATVRLRPGEQLRHQAGTRVSSKAQVDTAAAVSWRTGRVVFRDQTLAQVVAVLNRYVATPILVDEDAASIRFSGVLKVSDAKAMTGQLQSLLPVEAQQTRDTIALAAKPAVQ